MPELLELAKLLHGHSVAEVDVRRGGIDAELDPQRPPFLELGEQFLFGDDPCGAAAESRELLGRRDGRHGTVQQALSQGALLD